MVVGRKALETRLFRPNSRIAAATVFRQAVSNGSLIGGSIALEARAQKRVLEAARHAVAALAREGRRQQGPAVELAARMPAAIKMRRGRLKHLFKESLRGALPRRAVLGAADAVDAAESGVARRGRLPGREQLRARDGPATSEDQPLEHRVGGEPVGSVQTGARDFAHAVKPGDFRFTIQIRQHAAALVMRRGHDRDRFLRHVDAEPREVGVEVRVVADRVARGGGAASERGAKLPDCPSHRPVGRFDRTNTRRIDGQAQLRIESAARTRWYTCVWRATLRTPEVPWSEHPT